MMLFASVRFSLLTPACDTMKKSREKETIFEHVNTWKSYLSSQVPGFSIYLLQAISKQEFRRQFA